MKGSTVILDRIGSRRVAALIVDGRLDDLLVEGAGGHVPGAIWRATVDRPLKGQGGVIVRLGDSTAFLRQAAGMRAGQTVLVQIAGYAEGAKAVPATTRVVVRSRYCIVTPGAPGVNVARGLRDDDRRAELLALACRCVGGGDDAGLIMRTAASNASDAEVADDIAATWALTKRMLADVSGPPKLLIDGPDPHLAAWRDWPAPDTLDSAPGGLARHGVTAMIATLRLPRVDLQDGAWMAIEQTSALVAVDVNTGPDTSLAAGLKANLAAARALPAQLRTRGLGGQVTIDPAPMPKKDRRIFEDILRAALKNDAVPTVLAGWTPLGCFEAQRRRDRLPLDRALAGVGAI